MTRWAMTADLRRCVGCQTCTAACKNANATQPGIQWRRVLDLESGAWAADTVKATGSATSRYQSNAPGR